MIKKVKYIALFIPTFINTCFFVNQHWRNRVNWDFNLVAEGTVLVCKLRILIVTVLSDLIYVLLT